MRHIRGRAATSSVDRRRSRGNAAARALAKAHARTSSASIAPARPGFAVLHADGGAREGLHLALGLEHVDARSDARLAVEHLHGEREVKNAHLVTLRAEILELTARIGTVVFTWIPAEANGRAHALVAQALTRGGGGCIVAP